MKRLLSGMARAGAHANRKLLDILAGGPSDLPDRPAGGYFKSIMGNLNHILVSELSWLGRLRSSGVATPALDSEVLDFEHPGMGKPLTGDFTALRSRLQAVDAVFVRFVEELDDEALATEVERQDRQGNVRRHVLGFVLLHLLNHATHHRGQISQILDEKGIDNDYSGILQALQEIE